MTSRDQYDKLWTAYEAAHKAGDPEAISRFFTEDAMLLNPGQPPISGRQAIQEEYAKFVEDGVNLSLTVNVQDFGEGGDIAYGVGTFDGKDWTGNYLEVLKRQSDGSFLVHRICWNTH
jgi:ketosteroid isomerase-like protein